MNPEPRKPNRHKNVDYSQGGAYFVTVCTSQRQVLFGDVRDGKIELNKYGKIVDQVWNELPDRFPNVRLDEFVIMPNHFHGIMRVEPQPRHVGAIHESPLRDKSVNRRRMTIPMVIGYFKMNTAKQINILRNTIGATVWQRSFHDQIIRTERTLANIRQYIQQNPMKWDVDENNPLNAGARRAVSQRTPARTGIPQ